MHPRPEKLKVVGEAEHEYKAFREGPPTIIEPSRAESSQSGYQHGHLAMPAPTPLASNHLPPAEPSSYHSVPDMENLGFSMIGSISPRTRCPSLTESVLSSTGCTSPTSHSPSTPISDRGSISSVYGDGRSHAISAGPSYRDVQRSSHRYQNSHHHHQHRVTKSYQSSSRIHSSLSPPPLPMARLTISGALEHNKGVVTKHEKRRLNHLNSEKKRRENIKDGMDALFKLVPECRDKGMSKANILKMTREYILELHNGARELHTEIRHARQENEELRRYVGHQQEPYKFICRL